MSTAAYITTPSEGVNFNTTYTAYDQTAAITATNTPDNPGPPFSIGTYMRGTNESEFVFIKASAAISLGHVCVMDSAYNAQPITTALALLGKLVGVAVVAIASGSYGWIQRAGTVDGGILAVANTQPNVGILATTTAGVVDDVTTTGNKNITGMILNATNGTTTTSVGVGILNYPVVGTTTT
jgi:hypothetical protein